MRGSRLPLLCALAVAAAAPGAFAQPYPSRAIRLIVAFAPGGSVDPVARLVGAKLGEALGERFVIDNRPGAGGNLSAELAARSAPDGYTLHICSAPLVVNVSLYRKVGYDPVKDFAPVTLLANVQNVPVSHPSLPAKNVKQLIALSSIRAAKINALAVAGGKRSPALPGFEVSTGCPVLAPAGTPKPILERVNKEIAAVLRIREVNERLVSQGVEPVGSTPGELAAHIQADIPKWAKVVKISGARVD